MAGSHGDLPSSEEEEVVRNDIGFTIVGEGDTVRILPLDSAMISAMRRNSIGSPLTIVDDDTPSKGWSCDLCCYENGDVTSITCSVCGSNRGAAEEEQPNTSSEESPPVSSIHTEALFENVSKETNLQASFALQSSTRSINCKLNIELEPLPEEKKLEKIQIDKSKESDCSASINFEEMMTMSFTNWSTSDNGPWTCMSCTYLNQEPLHLSCEVCGHGRSKSNHNASHQSSADCFNASALGGQTALVENKKEIISDLEDKAIVREGMNKLLEDQFKILSELRNGKQDSKTETETGSQEKPKNLLEELQEKLLCMKTLLEQERREQNLAEQAQSRKRALIKRSEEGLSSLDHSSSKDTSSTETIMLKAQQRMLDDWKNNSNAREEQLEYVRLQQESLLERYRYFWK